MKRSIISRGLAVAILLLLTVSAFAADPAYYAKKGTWQDTMLASREALVKYEAAEAERRKSAGELPPQLGAMHAIGPFYHQGANGFSHAFQPEKEINLGATYGKLKWKKHPEWREHGVVGLPGGSHASTYIYRTITVPRPVTIDGVFGADDYVRAWLNGKEILTNHRINTPPNRVKLQLVKGENRLLIKAVNQGGGYNFVHGTSLKHDTTDPKKVARDGLWKLLERDFADPKLRRQMSVERRDGIWTQDWPAGDLKALSDRYLNATRIATAKAQAQKVAGNLNAIRPIYHMSRATEKVMADINRINRRSMRLAIKDLTDTFGAKYPQGKHYLARLEALEKKLPKLAERMIAGDKTASKEAEELARIGREALLDNPLLDFDKLLFVRRRANRMGLPNNWLGNCSIGKTGYDNQLSILSPVRPDGAVSTVYKPDGGKFVGDLELSFDGKRSLISMPGSHGRWQVFEIGVDGKGLRQVTLGDQSDVDNFDGCYLPDGRIIFCSTACFHGVPCVGGGAPVSLLYIMDSDGKNIRQLTFDQDHSWCPTVLNNGRVLYSRWEYSDAPHYFTRLLFHMNPDGTAQTEYYGSNSYWPNSIFYARPVPGHPTQVAAIISGHHGVPRMGELVIFDPAKGRFEADGVVQRIPGYGKKVQPIIRDALVNSSWPRFLHPYPLSDKYYLVSCKLNPRSHWGLYLVDVFDNLLPLKIEPGYALLEPTPVRSRPPPPMVPDKVDLTRKDAVVYLADIYKGGGLMDVPVGTIKKLRVYEPHFGYNGMGGHINIGIDGPWDVHRILGTVPVHEDGSALFRVPANIPFAIQPLDAEGRAVQLMRSWMTAMPGETLSCVGCHEKQNTTPPRRRTLAAGYDTAEIKPWYGPARGFDFVREVQPVLQEYCVGCHDGKPRKDGKKLPNLADTRRGWAGFTNSYIALHPFVRRPGPESDYHLQVPAEYCANTSQLTQMLKKGHNGVKLDKEAWDRLYTWIDLNVPDHGTWAEHRGRQARFRKRRLELRKLYANVDIDPEAIPALPKKPVKFIKPAPAPRDAEEVKCANWPFDAAEAKRRQQAMGSSERTIELGGVKLQLAVIPPGEFVMGDRNGVADEAPLSRVKMDKPFWMAKFEITNGLFALYDPHHDSGYISMFAKDQSTRGLAANHSTQPVSRISWQQAMGFCDWLSQKTGQKFTLPTEAQWEYACRAGTATPLSYGDCTTNFGKFANMADQRVNILTRGSPRWTPCTNNVNDGAVISHSGGRYQANAWGLHDMHGNVAEWTLSTYKPYPYQANDGRNSTGGSGERVARGGSWFDRPKRCRSGYRLSYPAWQKVFNTGFRVVCEFKPKKVAATE